MNYSWAYITQSYLDEIYTAKTIRQSAVTEMGKALLACQCLGWQNISCCCCWCSHKMALSGTLLLLSNIKQYNPVFDSNLKLFWISWSNKSNNNLILLFLYNLLTPWCYNLGLPNNSGPNSATQIETENKVAGWRWEWSKEDGN